MSQQQVLDFGRRLREGFFSQLSRFAREIELVDDPELYPFHADFLSRLALTFSHGDYANNPLIKETLVTAVALFERALRYHPDHRAFWGLGLVYQHQCRFEASIDILEKGIRHHQSSVDLHMALAHSLMRLNRFQEARQRLEGFGDHPQAVEQLVHCCRLMADQTAAQTWAQRLSRLTGRVP
ncbi:tetratricopeptide repeat protein [Desulfosarcina cetonica]|uniref:tetratricopeptide repeat protein n=1 Tax=Desulfosarcina cetonica TaxID=90730 RepID=UPI001FEE0B98|nr:tetratricopeptide repeat protein [Desulfosarcina cetonica]